MAITTLAGILAGMQRPQSFYKNQNNSPDAKFGQILSYWKYGGFPGAGVYDTTLNGVALSSTSSQVAGQLYFKDPPGGTNCYLAKFQATQCDQPSDTSHYDACGTMYLCDRLWHNQINSSITTLQSITSPTWPARDNAGSTNGAGVFVGVEIQVGTNPTLASLTLSYTNSAGTSGQSGSLLVTGDSGASWERGAMIEIALQNGDIGVQSVQGITLGTANASMTFNMVAYRVLAALPVRIINKMAVADAVQLGLPQMYAGSVPYFMFRGGNSQGGTYAGGNAIGTVQYTMG